MKVIRNSKGFTLIELLVVVAIIGILAAIAIPQFAVYRQKGFNAQSESDLRNAATGEEALVAGGGNYVSCTQADCPTIGGVAGKLPGLIISTKTKMSMTGATNVSFTGTSCNTSGDGQNYSWNSLTGGLVQPLAAPGTC